MSPKKSRLGGYLASLKKWELQENPFHATPPDDPQLLAQIFYGRDQELDIAIPTLYEGNNIRNSSTQSKQRFDGIQSDENGLKSRKALSFSSIDNGTNSRK
jgi:hypothetical protein